MRIKRWTERHKMVPLMPNILFAWSVLLLHNHRKPWWRLIKGPNYCFVVSVASLFVYMFQWWCIKGEHSDVFSLNRHPGSKLTVTDEDSHLWQHAPWVLFTLPMALTWWHGSFSTFLSTFPLPLFDFFRVLLLPSRFSDSCTSHHITSSGPCRFLPDLICQSWSSPQETRKVHRFSPQGCLTSTLTPPPEPHQLCSTTHRCYRILNHIRLYSTLPHIFAFLFHVKISHCSSFWPLLNFSNAIIASKVWCKSKTALWSLH